MANQPSPHPRLIVSIVVVVVVMVTAGIFYLVVSSTTKEATKVEAARVAATRRLPALTIAVERENPLPAVIYAVTPATLSLDFLFNIEADEQLLVKYPDEKPILTKGKCGKLPQPRYTGPKVFTDPKDPNGHIAFRIYPIRSGDVVPPCK